MRSFFACYLLTSLSPRHKGHTYIGFTVNPRRRIRQHNGEIKCGAFRTKRKRPWEMVMCIYGFPTNVSALQFEWAWQHPRESLAVRTAAAELKYLSGVANKIKLAYTMLTLPSWKRLNLTVNFFSSKYITFCASCPSLPDHMKVQVQSMDDLPCYDASLNCSLEEDDENDFSVGDELNLPESLTDIVPGEIDAACGNSNDHQSDKAENGASSNIEQEKQPSIDMSDTLTSSVNMDESANGRSSQMTTNIIRDCSLDERPTYKTGASSQQLPTDEKYWSILDESSTWDLHALTRQKTNSNGLNNFPTCSYNGVKKSTPAVRVIASSADVEVIDLMTPSPECRVGILSKKKRDCSIIDLTRSPNFVQL